MDTAQLILSIVAAVIGVLGGAAGGNAMSKRNSANGDLVDSVVNDLYEELDVIHNKLHKFSNALDARVTATENALKKAAPAAKQTAKKPAAPAAKKAAPKKK